jgi:acylphosphatase
MASMEPGTESSDIRIERLHVIVDGRVQGVGFRYFVLDAAQAIGLKGWVRNRWDGSVEVVAEGPKASLERLLSTLYRGPRSSDVRSVRPEWLSPTGEFRDFSIKPTSG